MNAQDLRDKLAANRDYVVMFGDKEIADVDVDKKSKTIRLLLEKKEKKEEKK